MSLHKLKQQRMAILSFRIIISLYLIALFAGFFAPYRYDDERRDLSYCPPTKINFTDQGKLSRPFIYKTAYTFDEFYNRVYVQDTETKHYLNAFVRGESYVFLGIFKSNLHLFGVDEGARLFLMGADSRGRDLFSRIIYGSQISLSVGLVGVIISLIIGLFLGGIAGFYKGKTDMIIMRACEIIQSFPSFYLMLALRSMFAYEMDTVQIYFVIVFIMSFIGWPGLARIIRGMALSLRERDFVLAARAMGAKDTAIIHRHILPHTFSYIIISVSLSIPGFILGEAALSMLGLGIQDPHASWGNLLSDSMAIAQIKFHPWILIPGIFIFITVMASLKSAISFIVSKNSFITFFIFHKIRQF